MLVAEELAMATSEQMTYMATLAQVLPVPVLGIASSPRSSRAITPWCGLCRHSGS